MNLIFNTQEQPFSPINSSLCGQNFTEDALYQIREGLLGYDTLSEEFSYKAEEYAYRSLRLDEERRDEMIPEEVAWENYYQALESGNLGAFGEAEELIENGLFGLALDVIDNLSADNPIEVNKIESYQAFLTEYIQPFETFQEPTRTGLETLALKTPFEAGEGVFYARVMLDLITAEEPVPYSQLINNTVSPEQDMLVQVYPNPTDQEFFIVLPEEIEYDLQVRILDVAGREVDLLVLRRTKRFLRVPSANWESGMYVIEVSGAEKHQVERIVKN